jgi:large subunit ribosomal protein L2
MSLNFSNSDSKSAKSGSTAFSKNAPCKRLLIGKKSSGGRNNTGRTTSRFIGGGHKRALRLIDFRRTPKQGEVISVTVKTIEYDPNRSAFISLVEAENGTLSYILTPQGTSVGDVLLSSDKTDQKVGNCIALKNILVGTKIHNIELKPFKGGQIARSAGVFAQIIGRMNDYCIVRLPSGRQVLIHGTCRATIGSVSNPEHSNEKVGKAGRSRWLGRRPHVRGVAMNPVDHPHGGGEGRTSGGRHPVSPKGIPTKGKKTRRNKRTNRFIVK